MSPAKPESKPELKPRINYTKISPEGVRALGGLEAYVRHHSELEPRLLDLVRLRASMINGCAYCIDMHSKDLRADNETEQRIYELSAWREAPFYTERERAALAWTDEVTTISQNHVPDETYQAARQHFSEKELVDLTMAIVAINGWNRLAIGFRTVPGTYQPETRK
jgi:AhpD family alkylhydroperoxidase